MKSVTSGGDYLHKDQVEECGNIVSYCIVLFYTLFFLMAHVISVELPWHDKTRSVSWQDVVQATKPGSVSYLSMLYIVLLFMYC